MKNHRCCAAFGKAVVRFLGISSWLLLALPSAAQTGTKDQPTKPLPAIKDEVTAVVLRMKFALDGADKLQTRAISYCYEDSTFNPEEKLDQVLVAHILNRQHIPASELLHLVHTGVAIDHEMSSWFSMCLVIGKALEGSSHGTEASSVAGDLITPLESLEKANEQLWDLLARQIATEEQSTPQRS